MLYILCCNCDGDKCLFDGKYLGRVGCILVINGDVNVDWNGFIL